MTRALALLAAAALSGTCTQNPMPPPKPDGGATCTQACSNLLVLGCPEMGPACVPTCEHVVAERITEFDASCVSSAKTVEEVRLCPAIQCRK